eukprot:2474978-Amphidinium_carterae.1
MPVVRQEGGPCLRRGIGERGIEEGARTVPGCLGQCTPLLQADRTEEPCSDEIESLLKVSTGPTRRPIPQVRTLNGTVASIIRGVEQSCLTSQDRDCGVQYPHTWVPELSSKGLVC